MKIINLFGIIRDRILILFIGLSVAFGWRAGAQSCGGSIEINTVHAGASKYTCGFPEYDCDAPISYTNYLTKTETTSYSYTEGWTRFDYYVGSDCNPGALAASYSYSSSGSDNETTTTTYYDRFACLTTSTYSGDASCNVNSSSGYNVAETGHINNEITGAWDDGGVAASDADSYVVALAYDYSSWFTNNAFPPYGWICTPTAYYTGWAVGSEMDSSSNCYYDTLGLRYYINHNSSITSDSDVAVLSDPYTDDLLRADMMSLIPAYPTNSDGTLAWSTANSSAYYHLASDHSNAQGARMKYQFKITGCQPKQTYWVTWQIVNIPDGGGPGATNSIPPMEITTGSDPNQPYILDGGEIPVPDSPGTIYIQNWGITPSLPGTTGDGGPN